MSRHKTDHSGISDDVGGGGLYDAVPNSEYNTAILKFEKVTFDSGFSIYVAELGIVGGDYEESILKAQLWIPKGDNPKNDLQCEEAMDSFLYRCKARDAVEARVPDENSNSWFDENTIQAITLEVQGKAVRVATRQRKYPKKDGGEGTESQVTKFMFADMRYPSGTIMPTDVAVSQPSQAGAISGTGSIPSDAVGPKVD